MPTYRVSVTTEMTAELEITAESAEAALARADARTAELDPTAWRPDPSSRRLAAHNVDDDQDAADVDYSE